MFEIENQSRDTNCSHTYSLFPRHLANICMIRKIRFINISSDGVFTGKKGNYFEYDLPDAEDKYGISKYLGEYYGDNIITLRTSIIGHELNSKTGFLEWFLSQQKNCSGYTRSIFSGFSSIALSKIIRDEVLTRPSLNGLFHLASKPISKYDLLKLIGKKYKVNIQINPDEQIIIDRSLNAELFNKMTGFIPPHWPEMIDEMHSYKFGLGNIYV